MDIRLLTEEQIIGRPAVTAEQASENKRRGRRPWRARQAIQAIIPVTKSAWRAGIASGVFPAPRKLGRLNVWPESEIRRLAEEIAERGIQRIAAASPKIPRKPRPAAVAPLEVDELDTALYAAGEEE